MSETAVSSYLACYDYGEGGVWLLLDASSHAAAQSAFPKLKVFEARPEWMNEQQEVECRARWAESGFHWNIEAPSGWLQRHISEFR
jgi:hypothetical protein